MHGRAALVEKPHDRPAVADLRLDRIIIVVARLDGTVFKDISDLLIVLLGLDGGLGDMRLGDARPLHLVVVIDLGSDVPIRGPVSRDRLRAVQFHLTLKIEFDRVKDRFGAVYAQPHISRVVRLLEGGKIGDHAVISQPEIVHDIDKRGVLIFVGQRPLRQIPLIPQVKARHKRQLVERFAADRGHDALFMGHGNSPLKTCYPNTIFGTSVIRIGKSPNRQAIPASVIQ